MGVGLGCISEVLVLFEFISMGGCWVVEYLLG